MADEMEGEELKGVFVSYDENTGRGTIYPGPYDEYLKIKEDRLTPAMNVPRDPDDRCFYFQVPEELKHEQNFKVGKPVEYDRVSAETKEVTHLRF
ncbi:hypothetical protein K5E40_17815 [Pseudomonas baetica]|uniref:hypothetical protein n=1 Tax=Pseudomonas baetica TaxID=674054 RepID=UPI001C8C4B54|nr:hypothetical protein [Pseudomonas baetica]MBX9407532.1 hypothetical protein [Pseudomonas baetica]